MTGFHNERDVRRPNGMITFAVALLVAASALGGCTLLARDDTDLRKSVVIFIDKTASTENDRPIFAQAIERIISSLRPGDAIRISLITDSSSRDYVDVVECEIPDALAPQNMVLDSTLDYRTRQKRHAGVDSLTRASLRDGAARLLDLPSDRRSTAIFETLKIAAQVFAGESRPRQYLVLLSDMVETNALNFNRIRVDDSYIEQLVAMHEMGHILPDLSGVAVYAVGLSGATIEQTASIERLWTRYLTAAGATIPPGAFGRAMPEFGR